MLKTAGFLNLEEIDESEYGLDMENINMGIEKRKVKRKTILKETLIKRQEKEAKRKAKHKRKKNLGPGSNGNDDEKTGNDNKAEVSKEKVVKKKKEKKSKPNKKIDLGKKGETNITLGTANSDGMYPFDLVCIYLYVHYQNFVSTVKISEGYYCIVFIYLSTPL